MTPEKKQDFTRRITQANRTELVVIVYEILLVYIEDAMQAFEQKEKEVFVQNLNMVRECIGQLRNSLDFQYSPSKNLFSIYIFADRELAKDIYGNKKENLEVLKKIFTKLHDAYEQISKEDTSEPLMGHTQSVYAGLTYSKNQLSETCDYDSRRGYLA